MSINHNFSENKIADGLEYKKCKSCGKVLFLQDDDFFNLVCQTPLEKREILRRQLEGGFK